MKHFQNILDNFRNQNPVLATKLELAERILEKMNREGISSEELVKKADVPKEVVSQMEEGEAPSFENLVKLADALNLKVALTEK